MGEVGRGREAPRRRPGRPGEQRPRGWRASRAGRQMEAPTRALRSRTGGEGERRRRSAWEGGICATRVGVSSSHPPRAPLAGQRGDAPAQEQRQGKRGGLERDEWRVSSGAISNERGGSCCVKCLCGIWSCPVSRVGRLRSSPLCSHLSPLSRPSSPSILRPSSLCYPLLAHLILLSRVFSAPRTNGARKCGDGVGGSERSRSLRHSTHATCCC